MPKFLEDIIVTTLVLFLMIPYFLLLGLVVRSEIRKYQKLRRDD